jgi:hypothetical protein
MSYARFGLSTPIESAFRRGPLSANPLIGGGPSPGINDFLLRYPE